MFARKVSSFAYLYEIRIVQVKSLHIQYWHSVLIDRFHENKSMIQWPNTMWDEAKSLIVNIFLFNKNLKKYLRRNEYLIFSFTNFRLTHHFYIQN